MDRDVTARQQTVATGRKPQLSGDNDQNPPTTEPKVTKGATPIKDVDSAQYYRNISLHHACEEDKLDVVKYILSQGLEDINSLGKWKRTPAMMAAREGHFKVFDYLISQGCDLSAVDDHNNSVLHVACIGGNADIVKKLIVKEKLDKESRGRHGITPIMWTALYGHRELFELIVGLGCNLTAVSDQGSNILHLACINGHVNMVRYILSQNIISIESRGHFGRTPVLSAALTGQKGVFDFLIGKDCNLTSVDDQKNNMLHLACFCGSVDIVQYILSRNIVSVESKGRLGRTPALIAGMMCRKGVLDFLVKKGCDLTAVDDYSNTILHLACIGGNVDIVRYILSQNIVSVDSRGFEGKTPAMVATRKGKKGVFDFLVKKGCKLTTVDDQGNNILHVACMGGHVSMVKYLMTLRAVEGIAKARNKHGETLVQVAERQGQVAVVRFLKGKK